MRKLRRRQHIWLVQGHSDGNLGCEKMNGCWSGRGRGRAFPHGRRYCKGSGVWKLCAVWLDQRLWAAWREVMLGPSNDLSRTNNGCCPSDNGIAIYQEKMGGRTGLGSGWGTCETPTHRPQHLFSLGPRSVWLDLQLCHPDLSRGKAVNVLGKPGRDFQVC